MKEYYIRKWFRWALISLAIVALYGTMMRYKIAFDFPFFDQRNLLHAHSHFAFSGWISHVLYAGLALLLFPFISARKRKKYNALIFFNLVNAFGMLVAFTVQGYKAVSISFSTLSIVVAILFAWSFIADSKHLPAGHRSTPWAVTGLLLNVLSSAGPFSLAYMMATKSIQLDLYLGSVYYYLHFQYSGWFFFGSIALVAARLPVNFPSLQKYFYLFAATVIPTFFLSILWAKLPGWLYIITVAATVLQLATWTTLLVKTWSFWGKKKAGMYPAWINVFFYAALFSVTVKFLLQTISVIPSLSQLVFGIRPIVIAYLHLVLLGVYSLFIIGFLLSQKLILPTKGTKIAAFAFLAGVVLNELFLGIQGVGAFTYTPIAYINQMLFGAALLLLCSAIALIIFSKNNNGTQE
ncbi:MAG: hypothetical protein KF862_10460 [Chitinophagaceae bacterium]|nr:hypothetical protein [Chitinophagaceae bacterium]